jgi:hypothetical protein
MMPLRSLLLTATAAAGLLCGPLYAQAPGPAPASPQELFAAVARETRPQWRSCFASQPRELASHRDLAALALGATAADCYLAAEARDAQQLRNLVMDMAALEKLLGIHRHLEGGRQKLTELAESGDWKGLREALGAVTALHAGTLTAQRDEALAELENLGLWVRSVQIAAQHAARTGKPPERPCVWSAAFVASLSSKAAAAAEKDPGSESLRILAEQLARLKTLWPDEGTPANAAERTAATRQLMDALCTRLFCSPSVAPR